MYKNLNPNGSRLSAQLVAANAAKTVKPSGRLINVAGVGRVVSAAYEQLRNAAEYAQDHLLIQRAIRRFYIRNVSFHTHSDTGKSLAEELVIELTQAGYIKNNTQPIEITEKLGSLIKKHYGNFWRLKAAGIDENKAKTWTLDLLSVDSEDILAEDQIQTVYLQFAYRHYLGILQKGSFASNATEEASFEASIYIAVHRALLKSDLSAIRSDMQKLYRVSDNNVNDYAAFHDNVDLVFSSPVTNKIVRYINKYGAPLRVFRSMVQDNDKLGELMTDSERFNSAYASQIRKEYRKAEAKLNKGLMKSILFLLITKSLIGIGLEVPYDLATTGVVLMIPLLVNLFTPIVYLSLLRLGFKLPGETNAKAMRLYADGMLYGDNDQANLYPRIKDKKYPVGFTVAYIILFLIVFGFVSYALMLIEFNILQGILFFVFLAAASFLGFRLSRIVREIELITAKPGFFTTVRDLIFTPFTFMGKWISEKYQKVNVVALVLDTLIELPLKTILRLMRQWTGFIDEKKEDI